MKKSLKVAFTIGMLWVISIFLFGILSVSAQTPIQFAPGQTTAWLEGHVQPGGKVEYTFYAMKNQVVSISIRSDKGAAYFGYADQYGTEYLKLEYKYRMFVRPLRDTGAYKLTVYGEAAENYVLTLTIAPLEKPANIPLHTQNGGQIQIAPGQSTAWVSGTVQPYSNVQYQFFADKYQVGSLAMKSSTGQVYFGLVDPDGTTYLDPSKEWTYYISPLHRTGMYNLTVYNTGGTAATYDFQLTIPPFNAPPANYYPTQPVVYQPTTPPAPPQIPQAVFQNGGPIRFGSGEPSALIAGRLQPNSCLRYTFYAGNNYHLILLLSSTNNNANLGLSDVLGTTYLYNTNDYSYWTMMMAKTTTYNLDICNKANQQTDYNLNLIIPARINFDPNQYSATRSGTVKANGVVSYSVQASAGQMMNVNLSLKPNSQAYLRITGMADGVVYLDNNLFQTSWFGYLPSSQDYLIDVVSYGLASGYDLSVTIK